jgi:hypothetical protein
LWKLPNKGKQQENDDEIREDARKTKEQRKGEAILFKERVTASQVRAGKK